MPETVNTAHRGIVGDQPATFIVFYAGTKGMPLSQPAKLAIGQLQETSRMRSSVLQIAQQLSANVVFIVALLVTANGCSVLSAGFRQGFKAAQCDGGSLVLSRTKCCSSEVTAEY
jgi:hypothetical protein